jgi:KDO2-lipid IV(A) lauroyltransferase
MSQETPKSEPLPFGKRLERVGGAIGLRLIVTLLQAMPFQTAQAFGRGLGGLIYRVLGRYRRVSHKNLRLVYGTTKTEAERERMARGVFTHFGQVATEFVKLPRLEKEEIDRLTVAVEGEEHIRQALEEGKGMLLITGHFGNWEFLSRWLTTHGYKLNVVARAAEEPTATKLLTDTRTGNGANVLYRGNAARGLLGALKRNEIAAILPDQNAGDVFVPFFGFPTGTAEGPAVFHLKTGSPLLFSWCVRTPDNRFRITFEPLQRVEATGDAEQDKVRVMTLVNARLEAQIRQYPTQWLWLHDRWKSSPGVFTPDGQPAMSPSGREESHAAS